MVQVISDASEIPRDRKVVIDFFATWCGPCKQIAPYYEQLAETFPTVVFVKADVDEFGDGDGEFNIQMLPTFVLLNKGEPFAEVKGADINKLMKAVGELERCA